MMKKIKDYLLEDCGKTRAYEIYTTVALVAYMIGNCYLRDKLDKVTHQKKKLESDLEYKDNVIVVQNRVIDDHQKVIEKLTDKLEEK